MTTEDNNQNNSGEEKLLAGKFKTVPELEQGYKNSLPVFQENETLKKKLDEVTKIPDSYMNPNGLELDANRLTDIQTRAKEAGLTQAQYEKFASAEKARIDRGKQNFETLKKEVGEETLNILTDYVSKHYPPELKENMINTFIGNKDARQAALNHRQNLLNNKVPGMDKTSAGGLGYTITKDDIDKAYKAKETARGRDKMPAINHYMNLISAKAAQDKAAG